MKPGRQEHDPRIRQATPVHDRRVEDAVRIVAALEGSDETAALASLHATARRAGVGVEEIARGVVLFHGD